MTRTVEELAFERRKYRDELSAALTKMEGLYRIIYGYNKLDEKPSDNQEYIAMNYVLETRRALADENGWTGRKCPECKGEGGFDYDKPCRACGGTGEENVNMGEPDAPEATPAPAKARDLLINAFERAIKDIERLHRELKEKYGDNWIGIPDIINEYKLTIEKSKVN